MKLVSMLAVLMFAALPVAADITAEDILSGPVKSGGLKKRGRMMAIRQMALETGIVFGRNQFIREYRASIEEKGKTLDLLDFSILAIAPHVLPPVIVVADDVVDEESGGAFQHTGRMYRIVRDAMIVSSYPTWRDYLLPYGFEEEDLPNPEITLKNSQEKAIWKTYAQKGIAIGKDIAKGEVEFGLARMIRDYEGMLLAKYLERINMVRFSVLRTIATDVVNTGKALDIDMRYIHLEEDDLFTDENDWGIFIRKEDGGVGEPDLREVKKNLVCHFWRSPGGRLSRWFGCASKK